MTENEVTRRAGASPNSRRAGAIPVARWTHVRAANSAAIIQLLLNDGPMARSEIADTLGLTPAPVSRIVRDLLTQGLVVEDVDDYVTSPVRGRPRLPLRVVDAARTMIGVHVGVEHVTAGVADLRGVCSDIRRSVHDGSPESAVSAVREVLVPTLAAADARLLGVGLVCGGWVDPASGVVCAHDVLGWSDVDLRGEVERAVGYPVAVDASIRGHAEADLFFGAARGHTNFLHVFCGNVLEIGVVTDRTVVSGPAGFGGSVSNWPVADDDGRMVPASELLTDPAVVRAARSAGIVGQADDFENLVALAATSDGTGGDGPAKAWRLLARRAERLGAVIGQLNALLGPELVVVSSGVVAIESHLDAVREGASRRGGGPRAPIEGGLRGADALVTAGAAMVLRRFFENSAGSASD